MTGKVISDKMMKTRVVKVDSTIRHPKYGKLMKRSAHYKAHDEKNEFKTGDRVEIIESRPLSREKRWVVEAIVKKEIRTADSGVEV